MKHVLNHTRYGLEDRGMTDSSPHLTGGENGLIGTENFTHFNSSGQALGLGSGSGSYSPTNMTTTPHTTTTSFNHQDQLQHHGGPPSPTQLLRKTRSAFQMLTQNPQSEDSIPSPSSSSSSAMTKMLSQTRSSPMIVSPSGQPTSSSTYPSTGPATTQTGGRGHSSNSSPARAKSPLAGYGSNNSGGEGLSGLGIGGGVSEHPPTSSNRVKGLIRRLGVGSSSRQPPKETTFSEGDVATWRSVSPTHLTHHHGSMDPTSSSSSMDPQQVSHAVAVKRKMSLRKSLISMSPFSHKPSSSTTNSAPDAATTSTGH